METIHQQTTAGGPAIDDVYEILASTERRAVLDDLASTGGELAVSTLVERFSDREGTVGRDADRYHIRLLHQHLPKMAHVGIVHHDTDARRVTLTQTGYRTNAVRLQTADLIRGE